MSKLYTLLALIFLLVSCKTDSNTEEVDQTNAAGDFSFGNSAQRNFHGLVLSTDGIPVSGATVTVGTKTTQTNIKGLFAISDADVKENFAYVKVTKAGFLNGTRTLVPTTGNNRINIMMIPATNTMTVNSGIPSTVSLPNGTKVKFDGSFKDESGGNYTGNVNVAMFHLAPSNMYLNELMPGSFLATNSNGNSRIMETFGMLHVQLTGSSGQKLQIATNHTAEITLAIDAAQSTSAPAAIPLWAFNETSGLWQEEGVATKVGNTYVGNVSHFSWWNCDLQLPLATLKVNVKNSAGQPLSNLKIGLKRSTQIYETYGMTDNTGSVSGLVPANETLVLKVYNFCGTVLYTANVGPFTAGNLHTLPDIIIPASANTSFTVTGTLKNCAGANVTNGVAVVQTGGSSNNYFQSSTAIVTNGMFSINILSCNANQQFSLEGYDFANMQTSSGISFTGVSPVTNLGNITLCTAVNEYITYQIDSQSPKNLLPPIGAEYSTGTNAMVVTCYPPNSGLGGFQMVVSNISGVGTYTTFNHLDVIGSGSSPSGIPSLGSTLTLQIINFGAVGQYIDFTINGTYINSTGTHTLSVTGHVIRDN
ncbi:carboxypeptidase-like regulatory domain-containing protein [Chryseobacterium wangxinyae]|uniref:carboxypeptidase-like regulatory domain-containing protein n=1 Tax=Chryseobacterium sp. CY350 TaxID=2997336 RepID=UPI002271999F|nr:carboxypeptidase-like regulatory domain-containing protein [Chryseobacterium sp. CY350]MCY0979295.1 carboxypeptidase-like regulatory domain-containing protein [Chryseobacterium sp. CY350]WBZ95927.1 carboxypeptidase-like regulatory domain-containing protein [Chryseobacterium sp. CY350]